jgi:hypothetical protein
MGFKKIQTYILESENGASLRASGFMCEAEGVGELSWKGQQNKRQRARDSQPEQLTLFDKKTPPRELKKRYAKYF